MKISEILNKYLNNGNKALKESVDGGRIPIAYLCSFVPPEIIQAAGGVAFRLMRRSNGKGQIRRSRYIREDSCVFCRECLSNYPFDFLPVPKILVAASPCDQMRRVLELFNREHGVHVFQMHVPRTGGTESNIEFYRKELSRLGETVAEITGKGDWINQIRREITRRNRIIQVLKENLLQTRCMARHPKLSNETFDSTLGETSEGILGETFDSTSLRGPEIALLALLSWELPPDSLEELVTELENELSGVFPVSQENKRPRILLTGSMFSREDVRIFRHIEDYGADIVADIFCNGIDRLNREDFDGTADPLEYLARNLLSNSTCPSMRPNNSLYESIQKQIEENAIDAIIHISLKYCHPWGFEKVRIKETFGLPFLSIDNDSSPSYEAQWQTRISAFLESLTFSRQGRASIG